MITVRDLVKHYAALHAVDGISFNVARGETFGLLGPNGAGKTTTMHMLVGAITPDAGSITLDDRWRPTAREARQQIGIAPQSLALYNHLTGRENLRFFARLYGLRGRTLRERVEWGLAFAGLTDRGNDRIGKYSGGMQRRLNVACALLHDPMIVLLDEPTAGVDPQSRNHLYDAIEQERAAGRTILYTTHYMEEAQRLCDRVAIMDHGRVLALDTVAQLIRQHADDAVITAELARLPGPDVELPAPLDGTHLRFSSDQPLEAVGQLAAAGVAFQSLKIEEGDLESVFLKLTGRSLPRLMLPSNLSSTIFLALKDLKLLVRDPMSLFFAIVFPIIMGVFFGIINNSIGGREQTQMSVAIVNEDESEIARRFVRQLGDAPGLTVVQLTREEATARIRSRNLAAFIAVPARFGESAGLVGMDGPDIEIGVDPSRKVEAAMLEGFVMEAMGAIVQHRFEEGFRGIRALFGLSSASSSQADEDSIETKAEDGEPARDGAFKLGIGGVRVVEVRGDPKSQPITRRLKSGWDLSFPSAMLWGVMACVACFAVSIAQERTEGTFLRLTVSPISRVHVLAGKGLACFLATLVVIAMMTGLGLVLGLQLTSAVHLVLASLCVAFGFAGLMMMMAVLGKTEQSVAGAGWALIVIMCMFGGAMMPLVFMPDFMKTLSVFSPVSWAILALEGAIWRGFTFAEMLYPCGVLVVMGVTGLAIGSTILSRVRA